MSHIKDRLPFSTVTEATLTSNVRRLGIYVDETVEELFPSRFERESHLRSLLYFGCCVQNDEELVSKLFRQFKLLRVLKLEDMATSVELPNAIGKMVHLRFLSLRGSDVERFPSSRGNLICMQTMDLRTSSCDMIPFPDVLWKMRRLRHLYLPLDCGKKFRLSTLHDLQTLYYSGRRCDVLNELTELTSLRKLVIQVTSHWKNLEETLKSMSSTLDGIRSLFVTIIDNDIGGGAKKIVLSCRQVYKLRLEGQIWRLPDLQHFPNLAKLTLSMCYIDNNQMAMLEKVPNLKTLCLGNGTFEDGIFTLVFSKDGFRQLESLSLVYLNRIRDLKVEEGAMPSLRRLRIERCYALETVPDGLRYITTLQELSFVWMNSQFRSRAQVGGDEFHKIQHVPSVVCI